jgi:hypothetical protein
LLLLAACGKAPAEPGVDAGFQLTGRVDLLEPGLCHIVEGELRPGRDAWLTRWFGRESDAGAPALLGDDRPSLLVSTPSRLRVSLPEVAGPRLFRGAVRRERAGTDPSLRAELFWQAPGSDPRSLAAAELQPSDDRWQELAAELPTEAGDLWLVARHTHPGLAAQSGARLAWGSPVIAPLQAPRLPDIILLTVDTLRADAIAHMPTVRQLFAPGEWAGSAVAPSNWTLPSFASLWTGRDADQHGAGRGSFSTTPLPVATPREFTALNMVRSFPEALRDAGWATACVHQNPFLESWTGLARGFDAWIRTPDGIQANRAPAEAWWQANAHRPRLLVLHWMSPHLPYGAPDDTDPLSELDWRAFLSEDHTPEERRAFFDLPEEKRAEVRRRYFEQAAELDREITAWLPGILATARRPVLLFYSDHGEELWDAGSFEHGHSFDDSVVRVPAALTGIGVASARLLNAPLPAGHLGLHLLHRLGQSDERIAAALRRTARGLPECGFAPDCPAAQRPPRSSSPLYRAEHGGVRIEADGTRSFLPFRGEGSGGVAPILDSEMIRRLAELGYTGG